MAQRLAVWFPAMTDIPTDVLGTVWGSEPLDWRVAHGLHRGGWQAFVLDPNEDDAGSAGG